MDIQRRCCNRYGMKTKIVRVKTYDHLRFTYKSACQGVLITVSTIIMKVLLDLSQISSMQTQC